MKKFVLKAIAAPIALSMSMAVQALTPGEGIWVKETATYGTPNLQNAYVYVPKNASPAVKDGKRALMVTLHGCAMTAQGNVINNKYNWEPTAEQYGMVVVAPTVPAGTSATRSVAGCWDWFGSNHVRVNRDMVPLKKLIDAVKSRSNLDIDPNQIYFTGLSSGGGETIIAGCMLPDYFAGIGINAGPALGSGAYDIWSNPKVTASQVKGYCEAAATSSYKSYFATQIANAVYGTADTTVKPSHNIRNLEGLALVYGMSYSNPVTSTVAGGGTVKTYKDDNGKERLTDHAVTGMGHAWPAGGGSGASYVDTKHINYPAWITAWFFNNNLRVSSGGSTTTTTSAGSTTTTAAVTTTTTTTAGACFTASNYAHVVAGRAYYSMGYAKANGSNQNMGLYNTFTTTKLRRTGTNYYVIDSTCP